MKSHEYGVKSQSDIYFFTSSPQAKNTFFYPLCVGHFTYEPYYHLSRDSYDSFLVMFIISGDCTIRTNSAEQYAATGQIILLDCYRPHEYYTNNGWEALWMHFDGISARGFYNMITSASNHIITLKNNYRFQKYLTKIYETFQQNGTIKEALLSNDISNVLTELILDTSINTNNNSHTDVIEDIVAYINDHLVEELSLQQLSSLASLSPYYFSRLFKKDVGMPPHEYVIETRVHAAKFYLKTTSLSIKEIATKLGFHCESSFCTTFKNKTNLTPSMYRNSADR